MNRPNKGILRTLSLLLSGMSVVACGDGDPVGLSAPTAEITAPAPGSAVPEGSPFTLTGSADDPQDGVVPGTSLSWSSSIDGALGSGESVEVPSPSVGVHTITLVATDSDGNEGSASISVSVEALPFIEGTPSEPQVGVIVNTLSNSVRLFQVGDPTEFREIALGASSTVTATGVSVGGERAAVPLGNAASVALLDLRAQTIESFFLFTAGNASGSDFTDASTVVVANQTTDIVGRFSVGQPSNAIVDTVPVTQFPNDVIAVSESLVLVVSSNLDDSFAPAGDGIVTAIYPRTMTVVDTVGTGGTNPQFGDLGPDGLLYVVNTGDFASPSTMAVIDPATMERVDLVEGFPAGAGDVHVDAEGLVYVSAFFTGTVVWDSSSETFVRDGADPVCAPLDGGGCRGAFSAYVADDGSVYQTFFGSASEDLSPWIFRYEAGTLALTDSIASGLGPVEVEIHSFR